MLSPGIILYFLGIVLGEGLRAISTGEDLLLDLTIRFVPLGLFVVGSLWYVLPEWQRVLNSKLPASRTPKIMIAVGALVGFTAGIVVEAVYNIAFEVFQTELTYPPTLAWVQRLVSRTGWMTVGAGAILSRQRAIPTAEEPPLTLTLGTILAIPGFFILLFGLIHSIAHGLEGLILMVFGAIYLSLGLLVRRREKKSDRPSTESPRVELVELAGWAGVLIVLLGLPVVVFFTLPGLLIVTAGAALYVGWWLHRNVLKKES